VCVVQHVHDVGTAHAGGIIQAGVVVASRLQIHNAVVGVFLHVFLGAEDDGAGGAGLDAGRLLAHRHPIGTQSAFIGLVVFLGKPGNVERAAGDAIAAAYAVFLVEIHNAVVVLD